MGGSHRQGLRWRKESVCGQCLDQHKCLCSQHARATWTAVQLTYRLSCLSLLLSLLSLLLSLLQLPLHGHLLLPQLSLQLRLHSLSLQLELRLQAQIRDVSSMTLQNACTAQGLDRRRQAGGSQHASDASEISTQPG